jgi:deazaflavin-dependent oxidoreductase (nitroreductase family)
MAGDSASSEQPDLRERLARRFFRLVNPLACRMIPKGVPTGAPNIVLIVRGRRSGIERPTPVAMLEVDGDSYVQATYGAEGWARNLRAAGEASIVHSGGRRSSVHAIEVPPDKAAVILRGVLEPYRQLRFMRRLLGDNVRPPVALLRRYRVRIDDTPEDYLAEAQRHPLFELRPASATR